MNFWGTYFVINDKLSYLMEINTRWEDLEVVKNLWGINLKRNDFTFGVAPSNIENCIMIISNLRRKHRKLSELKYCGVYRKLITLDVIVVLKNNDFSQTLGGTNKCKYINTIGSRFATVRFTTIRFYDLCRVGQSTPDLWYITAANQASFFYLVRF